MIQILDDDRIKFIPGADVYLGRCLLCGILGFVEQSVPIKPTVHANGQLCLGGGKYEILYCHDTCFNNSTEPLDYVLRQRGGVPHSFSLRN